jgi:hypothetical protein
MKSLAAAVVFVWLASFCGDVRAEVENVSIEAAETGFEIRTLVA